MKKIWLVLVMLVFVPACFSAPEVFFVTEKSAFYPTDSGYRFEDEIIITPTYYRVKFRSSQRGPDPTYYITVDSLTWTRINVGDTIYSVRF